MATADEESTTLDAACWLPFSSPPIEALADPMWAHNYPSGHFETTCHPFWGYVWRYGAAVTDAAERLALRAKAAKLARIEKS